MATLYLLPVPISADAGHTIPTYATDLMQSVQIFVMERGKTGRQFMKELVPGLNLQEKTFIEMGEAPHSAALEEVLAHLQAGRDVAVLSESGCPGVADPGAGFVEAAHQIGVRVQPVVGPSSILLALMASGMNGQQFAFIGYLTNKKEDLPGAISRLEDRSRSLQQTQMFIETPYRNQSMLEALVKQLSPATRLCVAYDLTGVDELVISQSVQVWRKRPLPVLAKKPALFLVLAG